MKPIAWIVGGCALSGLAATLENLGGLGSSPAAGVQMYLPSLLILLVGQYCLWRGFRSGIVAVWSGAFDRGRKTPASDMPRPAFPMTEIEPAGDFDADAAFARYMEKREADQSNPVEKPAAPVVPQPARPTFGRRNT